MTRDSKYIITQHWKDQQICIFDLQTFIESEELCRVATLKGNYSMKTYVTGGIKAHSIAVSCIGGFVAAGSEDHKLRVWDAFPSATTSTHLLVLWCHMIIKVGYGNAPRIMMQITRFLWRRYGRRVRSSMFERSRSIVSLMHSRTQVRDPLWLLEKNERSWVMIDSPLIEEEKEEDD